MNRLELAKTVWEIIGESDSFGAEPGYGGGVDTRHALWRGACELARRAKPAQLRKVHPLSILSGTQEYPLPDDFLCFQDLREPILIAGKPIDPIAQGQAEQLEQDPDDSWVNVNSIAWYDAGVSDVAGSNFQKRLIGFFPIPNVAASGQVFYLRKPIKLTHASMTDTTEYRDIPEHYHMALAYYAVYEFFHRQAELPVGVDPEKYLARFESYAADYVAEVNADAQGNSRPTTPSAVRATLDRYMEA